MEVFERKMRSKTGSPSLESIVSYVRTAARAQAPPPGDGDGVVFPSRGSSVDSESYGAH